MGWHHPNKSLLTIISVPVYKRGTKSTALLWRHVAWVVEQAIRLSHRQLVACLLPACFAGSTLHQPMPGQPLAVIGPPISQILRRLRRGSSLDQRAGDERVFCACVLARLPQHRYCETRRPWPRRAPARPCHYHPPPAAISLVRPTNPGKKENRKTIFWLHILPRGKKDL